MKKWILATVCVSLLLALTYQSLFAEEGSFIQKIDKILSNQEQILKDLSEIKSELQIVKVRATNR
jgi:type II secretory pathway component PulM